MIPRLPLQLQNTMFRFYRANGKRPIDLSWTTTGNFSFFENDFQTHDGTYGVCGGHGGLIILDFDDRTYYESVKGQLPPTFTVLSAGKRLPHLYYILDGEMIVKQPKRDATGKTLVDVQAAKSGVIGPGSEINGKYYWVVEDLPIATITLAALEAVLGIQTIKPLQRDLGAQTTYQEAPDAFRTALRVLNVLGVRRTSADMFECPFHPMSGIGNLHVMPSGKIHCFHEGKTFANGFSFHTIWSRKKQNYDFEFTMQIAEEEYHARNTR